MRIQCHVSSLKLLLFWITSFLGAACVASEFTCADNFGIYPMPNSSSCREYYECSFGVPTPRTCGEKYGYHSKWRQCTWEGFADTCNSDGKGKFCGLPNWVNGSGQAQLDAPWVVAVYQRSRSGLEWDMVGPGIIISPSTIITTCRLGRNITDKFRLNLNASSFHIVYGSSQTIQVSLIQLNPRSSEYSDAYCNALMHLEKDIDLEGSPAKAICLPIFKQQAANNENTEVGRFANGKVMVTGFLKMRNSESPQKVTKDFWLSRVPFCNSTRDNFSCLPGIPVREGSSLTEVCVAKKSAIAVFSPSSQRWYVLGYGSNLSNRFCNLEKLDSDPSLRWIVNSIRCGKQQFPCADGSCIDINLMCNGQPECLKGEDENHNICRALGACVFNATFECSTSGKCVEDSKVCNGVQDCPGGEDEDPSVCKSTLRLK